MSCKRFSQGLVCVPMLLAVFGCGCSGPDLNAEVATPKREQTGESLPHSVVAPPATSHGSRAGSAVAARTHTSDFTFTFRLYQRPGADPWIPVIYMKALAGDFNGDGRTDLVFGLQANEIEIVYQNENGGFSAPQVFSTGTENYLSDGRLVVGDFNMDGIDDIVFDTVDEYGVRGGIAILRSRAGASPELRQLHPPALFTSGSSAQGWAAADIDGDNQLDLVALHNWPSDIQELGLWDSSNPPCEESKPCHHYIVYEGDGRGGLGGPRLIRIEGLPDHQITADFFVENIDRGEREEIFFSFANGFGSHDAAYVTQLPIDGNVSVPMLLHEKFSSAPLFFGDLDENGVIDSIHGNAIFLGQANGGFSDPLGLAIYYYMNAPWHVVADFDGNGSVDVVNHQFLTFGEIPYFAIYLQKNGELQAPFFLYDPPTRHFVKTSDERHAAATGDFNSDGCLDIALAIGYSGVLLLEGRNCAVRVRGTGGNLKPRVK